MIQKVVYSEQNETHVYKIRAPSTTGSKLMEDLECNFNAGLQNLSDSEKEELCVEDGNKDCYYMN